MYNTDYFYNARHCIDGTLLADLQKEDEYRLSVLELNNQGECDVVHYKIDRDSKGCYTIKADTGFTTVLGLVNYYKGKFTEMLQPLTEPCPLSPGISEHNGHGYANFVPKTDNCLVKHFEKEAVKLHALLVNGPACDIWKGQLVPSNDEVMIKTLNRDDENVSSFLHNEAMVINKLNHKNIVKFHGQSITDPVFLVYGYLPKGNLLQYLISANPCDFDQKCQFAQEIASALYYMNSLGYVHRNVQAINILLTSSQTCQLAGFGHAAKLDENQEYKETEEDKPYSSNDIRWMAPESMQTRIFSVQSDVWSYACTLLEIFGDGQTPFSDDFSSVLKRKILDGHKPQRPKSMSYSIYYLLLKCWDLQPDIRPSYIDIECLLKEVTPSKVSDSNSTLLNNNSASTPQTKTTGTNNSSNCSTPEKTTSKKDSKRNNKTLKKKLKI